MRKLILLLSAATLSACAGGEVDSTPAPDTSKSETAFETIGKITTTRPDLIKPTTPIEKLGGEYIWSEGPVWVDALDAVLFTDVPGNTIWQYKDGEGLTEWMSPSGAVPPLPDYTSSAGANGLIMYDADHIIVPDHGSRTLWKQNVHTKARTVLADAYEGKKLNSPNDAALHSSGLIFFTDPPFGLKGQDDSPAKELDFNGVYALSPDGSMRVVDAGLSRPNGVILSPDERTLYVANSLPTDRFWKAYDVSPSGEVTNGRVILKMDASRPEGNPDGMAMAEDGTIFATGPGGVLILSPEGEELGLIETGSRIANVTFGGEDGRDLYMTSHTFLARTRTEVKGHGF